MSDRIEPTGWGYLDFDDREVPYVVGDRFNYKGKIYRVLKDHKSVPDTDPTTKPDLYKPTDEKQGGE